MPTSHSASHGRAGNSAGNSGGSNTHCQHSYGCGYCLLRGVANECTLVRTWSAVGCVCIGCSFVPPTLHSCIPPTHRHTLHTPPHTHFNASFRTRPLEKSEEGLGDRLGWSVLWAQNADALSIGSWLHAYMRYYWKYKLQPASIV